MNLLWQQIPSPVVSEILADTAKTCGIHGVVLDTEHAAFNPETLHTCIHTINQFGIKSFVRVTCLDKVLVRMVLDAGVSGLIFSTVESMEQVNSIMEYCLYPPNGRRGQGLVRENKWGEAGFDKRKPCLVAQIETTKGIELIEQNKVEGFDYFMIGPYDLSASIGCEIDSDEYQKWIQRFAAVIQPKQMGFHLVKNLAPQMTRYRGAGLLAFSIDTLMLIEGVKAIEKSLKDKHIK